MHRKLIRKIADSGTPAQMEALADVLADAVDELDEDERKDTECALHRILYGDHLGAELAEEWVAAMINKDGTHGGHWTKEQAEEVRRKVAPSADPCDFYAALNMVYSDFFNPRFDAEIYAIMAKDWLDDADAEPGKALRYYWHIVA